MCKHSRLTGHTRVVGSWMGPMGYGLPSPLLDFLDGRNQEYFALPRIPSAFPVQSSYATNQQDIYCVMEIMILDLSTPRCCVWVGDATKATS